MTDVLKPTLEGIKQATRPAIKFDTITINTETGAALFYSGKIVVATMNLGMIPLNSTVTVMGINGKLKLKGFV